ncbi:hypothetical protein [Acidithiobacillus ferrivorans]|uniref:hypothetical protein n=1 Tax=Acidithiobacillus ferrivorans TaxID=160808 RepID=UPI001C07DC57|nr:hypothetical protein [Acidithiobacillus ferrivorans]MBU2849568.1 hypothetical protein [Acidithiobacillus ferrivorans]
MTRFPSFNHVPSETRRILRDRFDSKLRVVRQGQFLNPDQKVTPDQLVLRVLAGLKVSSNAEWPKAEIAYAQAGPTGSEPPNLQTLANLGWLRRIWGRAEIGLDLRVAALRAPTGVMDAFKTLLSGIHEQRYGATVEVRTDPELAELVEAIETGRSNPSQIVNQTPGWIAARLWELILAQEATPDSALRRWVDLRGLLHHPLIVPDEVWSTPDANTFRQAAISVIETEPGLGGWNETRDLYARQTALANHLTRDVAYSQFPLPPDTLVDRALWAGSHPIEASTYGSLDTCGDLFGLVGLLLADADAADNSPAPHPVVAQIIDLAIDRAELFIALLFQIRTRPRLLADLVIHPRTAGLACLLIAQWRSPVGAWDRGLVERDFQFGQVEAFADAVAILGKHLRAGQTNASEAAALLNWLHGRAGPGFIDDASGADSLMEALRRELTGCANSILLAMAQSLDGPNLRRGVGASEFAAVLDLSDLGGIADEVNADTIVTAYAHSISTGDYSLSSHRIGAAGAAALARMAGRTQALRDQFLYPVDVCTRLAVATPQDNEFILADSIGRSLRTHIRILCRAVVGGEPDVPADVFGALVAAVRTGALQHKEKGRVAAFAPRFESRIGAPVSDRPLAADLAAALAFVDRPRQETLLAAILETDEPLILAQLLSRSPPNLRSDIDRRLTALAPTDAGTIHTLPEMQARIDALLTAGAADAAASYMTAEEGLKTLGKAPGRELARFQNQLRLNFIREDRAAIETTAEPRFSAPLEQAAAVEALRQFRGLAAIQGSNRNSRFAKAEFLDLFARRPSFGSAANWFAAEITDLLQPDSFVLLKGDQVRQGQKAIAEFERMTAQLPATTVDEGVECNRALLLLAIGEPGQALAVLSTVTLVRLQDTAAAYRAIALARLGRQPEATATLDAAEHAIGGTEVLAAARSNIASGAPFLSAPEVSVYEDLFDNVASAIARFRTMNPADQARALQRKADPFEALLVEYVRAAADAVVSLVPMMKSVQIDSIEDDLNALIQQLLAARVQFLGWSVGDQSKGGFSAKGNAGERDLLITWGNSVLALIEAVICNRSPTQETMKADLESHFQKLLGYGNPRVFFHLTYAYNEDKAELMRSLVAVAETASPLGFNFLSQDPIPHEDSRPPGFVARYSADFGEVKVIFLVLNLGQQRQRQAAKTAGETRARKAQKSSLRDN